MKDEPAVSADPHLEVGVWPVGDDQWREAIAWIQRHLRGIMAICNKQAGPRPYDLMPYDEAILFWYAHLAEHVRTQRHVKALEHREEFIEV